MTKSMAQMDLRFKGKQNFEFRGIRANRKQSKVVVQVGSLAVIFPSA
jgi:hypothetical protein